MCLSKYIKRKARILRELGFNVNIDTFNNATTEFHVDKIARQIIFSK